MEEIKKFNRKRALLALIVSSIIAVLFFIALMIRLFYVSETVDAATQGLGSYRMFTIESNMLLAVVVLLSIPYQIDGYRNNNLHLPRWIDILLFVATTCTSLTFVIAVTILAPFAGVYDMLLKNYNLYMHLINPILAILLFTLILSDHNIKRKHVLYAMVPAVLYSIVYAVMVFGIGQDNGGWSDNYQVGSHMPWMLALALLITVDCGIAFALRALHNKSHAKLKEANKKAFQEYFYRHYSTIEQAVEALAKQNKVNDPKNNEVTVPRRIIMMLIEKYNTTTDIRKLSEIYVHEYLA